MLKVGNPLYELSAGNNFVHQLGWNEKTRTLFARTEHLYRDRLGRYYYSVDEFLPTHDYLESDEWPEPAIHTRNDFKCQYNSGANMVFGYTFL